MRANFSTIFFCQTKKQPGPGQKFSRPLPYEKVGTVHAASSGRAMEEAAELRRLWLFSAVFLSSFTCQKDTLWQPRAVFLQSDTWIFSVKPQNQK